METKQKQNTTKKAKQNKNQKQNKTKSKTQNKKQNIKKRNKKQNWNKTKQIYLGTDDKKIYILGNRNCSHLSWAIVLFMWNPLIKLWQGALNYLKRGGNFISYVSRPWGEHPSRPLNKSRLCVIDLSTGGHPVPNFCSAYSSIMYPCHEQRSCLGETISKSGLGLDSLFMWSLWFFNRDSFKHVPKVKSLNVFLCKISFTHTGEITNLYDSYILQQFTATIYVKIVEKLNAQFVFNLKLQQSNKKDIVWRRFSVCMRHTQLFLFSIARLCYFCVSFLLN